MLFLQFRPRRPDDFTLVAAILTVCPGVVEKGAEEFRLGYAVWASYEIR